MNTGAAAAIEDLKTDHWFSRVGVLDTDSAIVLSSWDEAIRSCSSQEWENFCLEEANQIRDKVRPKFPERYAQWNDITRKTKEIVIPILKDKYEPVAKENSLPNSFGDTVRWDVLGYFMELAYLDIAPPGFFHKQWEWYMKGHFPCGWEGEYPAGRPIVY